jgi:hypothetical protein
MVSIGLFFSQHLVSRAKEELLKMEIKRTF